MLNSRGGAFFGSATFGQATFASYSFVLGPFSQPEWKVTLDVVFDTSLRTWAWKYNPNLIGKDVFPSGRRFDWVLTPAAQRAENLKTWVWQYNLNLIGKDKLPTGEIEDKLPIGHLVRVPETNLKTWTWSYNLNLIGKDRFPPGEIFTALPAQRDREAITFIAAFRELLRVQTPFNQTDWALPILLPRRTNDLQPNTTLFMPTPVVPGKLMGQIWM